jgi:hypothetical protein
MTNDSGGNREISSQRGLSPRERAQVGVMLFVIAILGLGLYIANKRYYIRSEQLIEGVLYLVCLLGAIWLTAYYFWTYKEKRQKSWPRLPLYIPPPKDRRNVEKAFEQNAIVLGYSDKNPCPWPDDVRRMQGILLGQSGSGKTTVLTNIIVQDIQKVFPSGRRKAIIIFDGKGDGKFLKSLLFEIAAAGRLQDLRVLDPSQPDISVRYNPLHLRNGDSYQERTNLTFESFDLINDFFKGHQANYFSDIVRVLTNTGRQINIYDVLVMALDEQVLKEQISEAAFRMEHLSGINGQARLNFSMSAKNLLQSLQDRERVAKIQGLINELMVFTEDDLSAITCSYDNLLTLDDVIDKDWILFVSLNANRNARAVTALGRMLLQDLQLMVGKRYSSGLDLTKDGSPMVTVILDEFAPFAYPGFAQILQTARGSNISFLFSLQSIAQLDSVGRGFRQNITSAPNTIMLMKTWDKPTAEYFQEAASQVPAERLTKRVRRRSLFSDKYDPDEVGNTTPIKEPRVLDERIKNLPKGQIHVLMTDSRLGAPQYFLVHTRRASECWPDFFEPQIRPPIAPAISRGNGAHLRFKDPGLLRRFARLYGRKGREIAS